MTYKILVVDIEWAPALAYVWRMWDENISPDQLIDHGGMLCFGAQWVGEKEVMFFSEWEHGREGMAKAVSQLLEQADAVVTYNGDKYDLPKIRGEIVLAGLPPMIPVTSIDLLKTVKKFGFNMNRMAYIAPLLKLGSKMKHEGFNLWKEVLAGSDKARSKMERYCKQDVRITTKMYLKLKPYIANHPFLGSTPTSCPTCASDKTQKRGYRRTRSFLIQRNQCQGCGSWFETTRKKAP